MDTTTYTKVLAREVKAEAVRRDLRPSDLARAITAAGGLGRASVNRMMTGERAWDVESLSIVARELKTSVSELIRRADDEWAVICRCTRTDSLLSVPSQVGGLVAAVA